MYCSYCVLQVYHEHQCQVVFTNINDLEEEVNQKMSRWNGVVRFGTGEFADSLFLEERFGISKKVAALLEPYPNAIVEFKTKSDSVKSLDSISDKNKVVVGFSVNTPDMIALLENNTASLDKRLAAARFCEEMGFWLAFHFDPMIFYDGWEEQYRSVVRKIYSAVRDPGKIAWISMGGFRTMPELKRLLRDRKEYFPLFSGELLLGEDKKYRYFRPVRIAFYRAMIDEIEKHHAEAVVYLCMESPEVWEESGLAKRIPEGLVKYLDDRAEKMLGI
jgi:spore photoproduct lyase